MNGPLRRRWLAVLSAAALTGGGCTSQLATTAERAASFSPYAGTLVGQMPVRDYIFRRYAFLFAGDLKITPSPTDSHAFSFDGTGVAYGSAAAIDARGYFLTAAHCVGTGPIQLVFAGSQGMRIEPCRVVWRGDVSARQPDLAILGVAAPLNYVFDWAPELKAGEAALGVGPNYAPPKVYDLDEADFAGKVTRLLEQGGAVPKQTRVFHDGPAHPGDSGGPLTNTQGQLLGVNVLVYGPFLVAGHYLRLPFSRQFTEAQRPDLEWLWATINRDFAEHSKKTVLMSSGTP